MSNSYKIEIVIADTRADGTFVVDDELGGPHVKSVDCIGCRFKRWRSAGAARPASFLVASGGSGGKRLSCSVGRRMSGHRLLLHFSDTRPVCRSVGDCMSQIIPFSLLDSIASIAIHRTLFSNCQAM